MGGKNGFRIWAFGHSLLLLSLSPFNIKVRPPWVAARRRPSLLVAGRLSLLLPSLPPSLLLFSKLETARRAGQQRISLLRRRSAAAENPPKRLQLTFVGDITRLYSEGGLHCNVIANAANWEACTEFLNLISRKAFITVRLKPGGGDVNAAIFSAAGPALDVATKERAGSLLLGNAVVIPLPVTSPLFSREGITHVIHVLGPNMNPLRPNYLNNDYGKGCKVLREAYSSLFDGFASIVRTQANLPKGSVKKLEPSYISHS